MEKSVGFFFFFQAEDGIRDGHVTGVQTCALPIWLRHDGAGFALETPNGRVQTARLVLAAGAWTALLAAGLGLRLPISLFVPQMTANAIRGLVEEGLRDRYSRVRVTTTHPTEDCDDRRRLENGGGRRARPGPQRPGGWAEAHGLRGREHRGRAPGIGAPLHALDGAVREGLRVETQRGLGDWAVSQ